MTHSFADLFTIIHDPAAPLSARSAAYELIRPYVHDLADRMMQIAMGELTVTEQEQSAAEVVLNQFPEMVAGALGESEDPEIRAYQWAGFDKAALFEAVDRVMTRH
mgnify:CR=1 FL=1